MENPWQSFFPGPRIPEDRISEYHRYRWDRGRPLAGVSGSLVVLFLLLSWILHGQWPSPVQVAVWVGGGAASLVTLTPGRGRLRHGFFGLVAVVACLGVLFCGFPPLAVIVFGLTFSGLGASAGIGVSLVVLGCSLIGAPQPLDSTLVVIGGFLVCSLASVYWENQTRREFLARIRSDERDRLRREFLVRFSLDLLTPVTLMTGPLEAVTEGRYGATLSPEDAIFDSLLDHAHQVRDLATAARDWVQAQEGTLPVNKRPIDVSDLVRTLVGVVEPLDRQRGVSVVPLDETSGLIASLDAHLTEQTLLKMFSYARKATRDDGTILVRLRMPREGQGTLDVISSSPIEAKGRRDADLELALARSLMEVQGGTFSVQDRDGQGLVISLGFPLTAVAKAGSFPWGDVPSFLNQKRLLDAGPRPAWGGVRVGPRILIAQESADLRAFIQVSLGPGVYHEVTTGTAVLSALQTMTPDLIVVDRVLLESEPWERIREVWRKKNLWRIPVLVLTAGRLLDRSPWDELGQVEFLAQPFSGDELAARVRTLLSTKKVQDSCDEKVAELTLTRARFQEIVEFAASGILEASPQGRVEYINQTARDLLGVPQGVPLDLSDCWEPKERDRLGTHLAEESAAVELSPPLVQMLHWGTGASFPAFVRIHRPNGPRGVVRVAFLDLKPVMDSLLWPGDEFFDQFGLTDREREVAHETLRGLSTRETAQALAIGETTVKSHLQNLYFKMKVSSRKELLNKVCDELAQRYGRAFVLFSLLGRERRE